MDRDDSQRKIEELEDELRALSSRVARLEEAAGKGAPPGRREVPPPPAAAAERSASVPLTTGGVAALLSRFAVVSILLLFALVLRTVTDSGLVSVGIGSVLGMVYAAALGASGWILYRRSHPFAPLFSVSAALLFFAVVLETHTVFDALSSLPAYALLAAGAVFLAATSHVHRVALPVCAGSVGMIAAGLFVDFPDPIFLQLALFFLVVNGIAFSAVALPRCHWLRPAAFAATALVYLGWDYKIYAAYRLEGVLQDPSLHSHTWFLPALTVMSACYVTSVVVRIIRSADHRPDLFESLLPAMTVTWAYLLARLYPPTGMSRQSLLTVGAIGTLISLALLIMAFLIARYREEGAPGTNTLIFPAAFLLALSFRDLSGESVAALAVLSAAAFGLTFLSIAWASPGVRVTSYFMQSSVMGAAFLLLGPTPTGDAAGLAVGSMAAVSILAFLHYRKVRSVDPPMPSLYFGRIDRGDRSAVVLFVVSLAAGFLALRAGAYQVFTGSGDAFRCSQTVFINTGAFLLFLKSSRLRSVEVRNVAILVTVIGALKVFTLDLLGTSGLPLVLSVLSFGMAAGTGSLILGRWHRGEPAGDDRPVRGGE